MKKNGRILIILLCLIAILYISYRLSLYWKYDMNKEKKQIEIWNERVHKK